MLYSYEQELRDRRLEENEQKRIKDEEARFQVALTSVVQTNQGRKVLKKILSLCNLEHSSYASDPILTAYNEGIRTVGLQIKSLLGKENFRSIEDEEI